MSPWTAACRASLSFTISQSVQIRVHCVGDAVQPSHPLSNYLILCRPLLLLPSVFPSFKVFSDESALPFGWPKYWRFSTSSSDEYSGLISFRIDWFDLLAVQGTLKSSPAPQFKSINSSGLSLLYGPTLTFVHDCWKNHGFDCMNLCQQSDVSTC